MISSKLCSLTWLFALQLLNYQMIVFAEDTFPNIVNNELKHRSINENLQHQSGKNRLKLKGLASDLLTGLAKQQESSKVSSILIPATKLLLARDTVHGREPRPVTGGDKSLLRGIVHNLGPISGLVVSYKEPNQIPKTITKLVVDQFREQLKKNRSNDGSNISHIMSTNNDPNNRSSPIKSTLKTINNVRRSILDNSSHNQDQAKKPGFLSRVSRRINGVNVSNQRKNN